MEGHAIYHRDSQEVLVRVRLILRAMLDAGDGDPDGDDPDLDLRLLDEWYRQRNAEKWKANGARWTRS